MNTHIPWVEKYRPKDMENVVLSNTNKVILHNMIKEKQLTNILLYGPPGTGKTTTVINFIKLYQKKYNEENHDLVIHLNASDDRGIETIRSQIMQFVCTKNLFNKGTKFIILDEIDYMTLNAQIALKNLIQIMNKDNNNVVFCLIANYLSKITPQLQNMCLHMRFNQLPKNRIYSLLKNICDCEAIQFDKQYLNNLIEYFKSDIRSMINYMQLNRNGGNLNILTNHIIHQHVKYIIEQENEYGVRKIKELAMETNISITTLLEHITLYLFEQHYNELIQSDFFHSVQFIFQSEINEIDYIIRLYLSSLKSSLNNSLL
jgi:replication factor C subunit 3/5